MRDPYVILGVSRQADEAAIKKAFRKLAKQHHPDRNAGDEAAKERFSEVNAAYEILGDAGKRAQYDRGEIGPDGKAKFQGFEGFPGGGGAGREGFEGFSFGFGTGGPGAGAGRAGAGAEDIFSHLFGDGLRGGGRARSRKGEDVSAILTVTLDDIAAETRQHVGLPGGREVEVKLPAGVTEGQTIRLRGLGGSGAGGAEAGDVLLTIKILPQDRYTVEGSDLRTRCPIDLDDAVLGGKVRVDTPTGAVEMTIPPMTNSGKTFRLRGRGLPAKGGGRGDLFAVMEIRLPAASDEALAEYARARRAAKAG